ncbi:MAG: type II secretion system protein GspK [FCB group bacterium]|jgi:type II secretory pathway component PulK|nr:type II secretion system protein GspK [FCB group bacterium]
MNRRTHIRRGDEGVALLVALLFVVLLSVIVVEFAYENEVESSFVSAQSEQFESEIAAKSAVSAGLALLAADAQLDSLTSNMGGLGGAQSTQVADALGGLGGQYDSLFDPWAMGVPYRQINKAVLQCAIADEYGKINLNALLLNTGQADGNGLTTGQNGETPQNDSGLPQGTDDEAMMPETENTILVETLRALFIARGVEADPTDAILDWIDADGDSRSEGAENDFYQATDIPYSAKNAPFDSVEELLMVRGITPEIFFGDPELDQLPLTELLTVRGQRRGRINVNTAPAEVLEAFGIGLGGQEGLAERAILERESTPITTMEDAQSRGLIDAVPGQAGSGTGGMGGGTAGTSGEVVGDQSMALQQNPFVFSSKVFRIRGLGESGKAAVRIEAYVYRGTGMGSMFASHGDIGGEATTRVQDASAFGKDSDGKRLSNEGTGASEQMFRILDWRVER